MKGIRILSISLGLLVCLAGFVFAQTIRPSVRIDNLALRSAVDSLMKWYDVSIVYIDSEVEGKIVSAQCSQCTVEDVLSQILRGTSLTWLRLGNQIVLKKNVARTEDTVATISGVVADSLTGQWVPGATVMLRDSPEGNEGRIVRWCPTNDFGFYSLPRVSPGSYVLVVRVLSYDPATRIVHITARMNQRIDISLKSRAIIVQEVTVEGRRMALTSVEGLSQGIYIRTVPTDRNEYSLDGGRIFNPTHFGGVLSTFSPEILNDVRVVSGGLPPFYGGRNGGFVDLSLRDGNREELSGSASAGTLGSTLAVGGPLVRNTTFLVSGRRGYPDAVLDNLQQGGIPNTQHFSELVAKLTHRVSGTGQISLSGYLGEDTYSSSVLGTVRRLDNAFQWNNGMLDLRWVGIVSPSLFLYATGTYSGYSFDLGHSLASGSSPLTISSNYRIEDFAFHVHAEGYYDEDHTVTAGVELVHHRMSANISTFSDQVAPFELPRYSAWEVTVYLQDQWRLFPRVTAELGARATSFLGDHGTFSAIDPRFSVRAALDQQSFVHCSLAGVNQFIHPFRNGGVFLLYPTVFWYPSTESVRPSTSLCFSLGAQRNLDDEMYVASLESYYRITNNLHDFALDTIPPADLNSAILFGHGRTYGIVLSLRKRLGAFTGSLSYNLSWSLETFSELNGGREFESPFNRRHELQLVVSYACTPRLTMGLLCAISSGQPTLPVPPVPSPSRAREQAFYNASSPTKAFFDINGDQLPGFQRLELNMTYSIVAWNLPCQFSFRLLNGYGLFDPFNWNLRDTPDPRVMWTVTLKEPSFIPRYPALGLTVKF